MTRSKKRPAWKTYMSGNEEGYYVVDSRPIKDIYYGPFMSQDYAEFFNFVAFGDPRASDAKNDSKVGIMLCEEEPEFSEHPRTMFASNSRFGLWLSDTYGQALTTKLVLEIAKESGAKNYKSFTNWIIDGSKINGSHLGSLASNWQ